MNKATKNQTLATILIVDDLSVNIDILRQTLEPHGYKPLIATNGELALKVAHRAKPDLILLDIIMPGIDGFETCLRLKEDKATADIPVIFVTAKDETEGVIEGFRVGGVDYIQRPFKEQEVLARVETHLKIARLTKELLDKNAELTLANQKLQQEITRREQAEDALKTADEHLSVISQHEAERWGIAGFVAQSKTMAEIMGKIRKVQNVGTMSVLITGESGTGKELIARAIHFGGPRAKKAFMPVNCSAIPSELAESTLFGHIRGAFTGANTDRKGYFELAHEGTLFLDEIGDMPLELQPKLLRVLEDGCFIPVGATHEKCVDVRILTATNSDLQAKIAEGTFREDLYYRLARFTVVVPALRERPEDIPLLAAHFLSLFATEMGLKKPPLSHDALAALESYPFPGNVRELKNIIERALIESGGGEILPEYLYFAHPGTVVSSPTTSSYSDPVAAPRQATPTLPLNLKQAEAILIQQALEQTDGNMSESARLLGIDRKTLYRKLNKKSKM